jgi:hypothetical protein
MRAPGWFARILLPAVLVGWLPGCYVTHHYRTLDDAPEMETAGPLSVRLQMVAGEVLVRKSSSDALYDLHLRYCRSHFAPLVSREPAADGGNAVAVRLRRRPGTGKSGPIGGGRNFLNMGLNPNLITDLILELAEGRHLADLGGLSLRSLDVSSGSGDLTIAFDEPLSRDLEAFRIRGGPGGVRLRGLGNASPAVMSLSAGGGTFEIDLGGEWRRDCRITLDVSLGDVTFRAPRRLGLEVQAQDRDPIGLILPGFNSEGGGVYRSQTYDDATRHITIVPGEGLGLIEVQLGH